MTALNELASLVGIEESFVDARGIRRETPAETNRALLRAMGMEAETEEQAGSALRDLEEKAWKRALPPVCVAATPDGNGVRVKVVAPEGKTHVAWHMKLENGGEQSGIFGLASGAVIERHQIAGEELTRYQLVLDAGIPHGYHDLSTDLDNSNCRLIVTPGRCWLPKSSRMWGVAVQLYLLRSKHNWGIGDFTDLKTLVELVKEQGADVIGLNPLHALFLDDPERASPYSPESRVMLNVLNIDVEAVPELQGSPETQELLKSEDFQRRLEECRKAGLVNYTAVAALKKRALKQLFEFCRSASDLSRWNKFKEFRIGQGRAFEESCVFEALREHFADISGKLADWHTWPADYRRPDAPAVTQFRQEYSGAVTFHAWLQWLADEQLGAASSATKGMAVGLYRDLAVGTDTSGAATWSNPEAIVSDAHVGAPPDIFNPKGQDWGLPPFHPGALFETAYDSFIDLVRSNMRHAGGLRIDHVMALQHLYWVPKGKSPRDGAYVKYPLEDLVGILALESHRHQCLVVGEDLGTVPAGFRERMAEANILSYRVLFFEQDAKTRMFARPAEYPELALAVSGSHDLPTVVGWWDETDIDIKEELHMFPAADGVPQARKERERDRVELVKALREEGLLQSGDQVEVEDIMIAAHAYLARTKSLIAMMQVDDITAEKDPVNVPATSDEHANWRRRISTDLEKLQGHPRLERLARVFREERGK